ncbi:hypothetical protein [Apibacter adventoris]|uniref:Uncharacterized protein n=1 Tax=Apibacter adventoris TaxID=1679466 RepID=A0A2S8A4H2_9FLAO|nr:hypothetical protein [Apibacter adventoris]PQL89461.1 hypothetical protein C4S77_12530 [Apibacter adventoris]
METSKIDEIKENISNSLNYNNIKNLTGSEYEDFVINFFKELNKYKEQGIKKKDIEAFVNDLYTRELALLDDNDKINEEKFSDLVGEIIGFCPSAFFWEIPLDDYIKKWQNIYFPYYK